MSFTSCTSLAPATESTSTWRRKARRHRAPARYLWWTFGTQRHVASVSTLHWIRRTLYRSITPPTRRSCRRFALPLWQQQWLLSRLDGGARGVARPTRPSSTTVWICGASWQDCSAAAAQPKSPRRRSRRRTQNWSYTGDWTDEQDTSKPKQSNRQKQGTPKSPARPAARD